MSRAWPVRDIDPDAPVLEIARRVLSVRIAEYYAHEPIVNRPDLPEELHALRISAKRLRYTLELFAPWFGAPAKRQVDRVKAIQEALGDLHDHDVRIDMVGEELSRLMAEQSCETRAAIAAASDSELAAIVTAALRPPPDDPRRGLIALLGREHAARREAYARFTCLWDLHKADGMRAELVALSATPVAPEGTAGSNA